MKKGGNGIFIKCHKYDMTSFEIWLGIIEAIIMAAFYKYYLKQKITYFIILVIILFGFNTYTKLFANEMIINTRTLSEIIYLLPILLIFIITTINYITIKKNYYWLLFVSSMVQLVVLITQLAVKLITYVLMINNISYDYFIMFYLVSNILLAFLLYALTKVEFNLNVSQYKLLSIITILVLYMSIKLMAIIFIDHVINIDSSIIIMIIMITINIVVIYLLNNVVKQGYKNQLLNFAIEKLNSDKIQYNHLQKINEEVRMIRHDIKHQNLLIGNYLKHQEYDRINELIIDNLNKLNTQISFIDVGNDIINMVINNKMMLANSKRIKFINKIENDLVINIKDFDLNILLGNILDNAIENCYEDGIIEIVIKRINHQLLIEVKNSVLKKNIDLSTSKDDKENHGFGIKSIKRIVRTYHGDLQIFEEDGYFVVSILISA